MYTCSDAARLFPSQACRLVFLVWQLTNGTPFLDLSVDHQCQLLRTLRMDERVSGRKTKTNYKALKIMSDWQTQDKMFFFIKLFSNYCSKTISFIGATFKPIATFAHRST